jgi:dihydrofolate reductase
MKNKVFIATSMDGYIADHQGNIEWLHSIPNPDNDDMGYGAFMDEIDALLMGRNTFETICGFDVPWPYSIPVFVLSHQLQEIPSDYQKHAQLVKGDLKEVLNTIHAQGYHNLYIDGGTTIQHFLNADLIDEMIITNIPILLGSGTPLFGELKEPLHFKCIQTKHYLNAIAQNHYIRTK